MLGNIKALQLIAEKTVPVAELITHRFSLEEISKGFEVMEGRIAVVNKDLLSNWLEGAQLLVVYIIIAMAFFFLPT